MTSWTKIHRIIHHGVGLNLIATSFRWRKIQRWRRRWGREQERRMRRKYFLFGLFTKQSLVLSVLPQLRLLYSRGGLAQPLLLPLPLRRHLVHCDWGSKLFLSELVSFFCQTFNGWYFPSPGCSSFWSPPHWPALSRGIQAKRQHAPARGIFPSIEFWPTFKFT